MLEIRLNMNSDVEDVLNFKTCCGLQAHDQNLEILVSNVGELPVQIPSHCNLVSNNSVKRIETLFPPDGISVAPGEVKAFYCQMDEDLWRKSTSLVLFDEKGREHRVDIEHS